MADQRDPAKFDHVLSVASRLPALRQRVAADLDTRGYGRNRVLAAAARLLDIGVFRVGGEAYASDDDPSGEATYGLATLLREHVSAGLPSRPGLAGRAQCRHQRDSQDRDDLALVTRA